MDANNLPEIYVKCFRDQVQLIVTEQTIINEAYNGEKINSATHDITRHHMAVHHMTSHGTISHDITWQHIT